MHVANRLALIVGLVVGVFGVAFAPSASAAANGLTITPATLTLTLPEGQTEQTAAFTITNHYETPLSLRFSFEHPLAEAGNGPPPHTLLTITHADVTLGARQVLRQTIMLKESPDMQPGSQRADLVVTATGTAGSNVTLNPSIRMPLIIVKEAGAITSIAVAGLSGGGLRLTPPESITATIKNKGNMVVIPRGTLTITAPNGSTVGRGTLNAASQAASPGDTLSLATSMTKLANVTWPGLYKIQLSYGLGGGQAVKTTSSTFLYVAWWHLVLLVILAIIFYRYRKHVLSPLGLAKSARHPPSKSRFAKRGVV